MQHQTYRLTVDDGRSLHLYRWLPEARPRACVLLVHGIAEHAGRYQPLARHLAGRGYAVYAYDQRGHGLSASAPAQLGFVAAASPWQRLLTDIRLLGAHLAEEQPGRPRVLFGHSMGSLLAQDTAIEHGGDWHALVLQATDHRPGPLPLLGEGLARLQGRLLGARHRSLLLDFLTIGVLRYRLEHTRTPFDWLNRDANEVDAYIADPLCGFHPTVSLWQGVYHGTRRIARRRRQARIPRDLPVLLLAGGDDGLSAGGRRVRRLAERYRQLGLASVTLHVYPGARHELHRELNRQQVFADLSGWLDQHCPARSTAAAPAEETL